MRNATALVLALVLSSCDRGPDAPTAEESRRLDDAANLLNEAPANLEAIDDSGLGPPNGVHGDASEQPR